MENFPEHTQLTYLSAYFELPNANVTYTVTDFPLFVIRWLNSTLNLIGRDKEGRANPAVVGLQAFYCPSSPMARPGERVMAVLSLCVDKRCLVYQFVRSPSHPPELASFLREPNFSFVGVGIHAHMSSLSSRLVENGPPLRTTNVFDLQEIASQLQSNATFRDASLQHFMNCFPGHFSSFQRSVEVVQSDFTLPHLATPQIKLAVYDAFACNLLGNFVLKKIDSEVQALQNLNIVNLEQQVMNDPISPLNVDENELQNLVNQMIVSREEGGGGGEDGGAGGQHQN